MKPERRKKLEAAGWTVGTVAEFLGLTHEENALIELKLDLAKAVRAERTSRHLTQEELKSLLGSSQSRVAKMEAGDPSVSIDLLIRSLFKMGLNRQDVARHVSHAPTPLGKVQAEGTRAEHVEKPPRKYLPKAKVAARRLVTA